MYSQCVVHVFFPHIFHEAIRVSSLCSSEPQSPRLLYHSVGRAANKQHKKENLAKLYFQNSSRDG